MHSLLRKNLRLWGYGKPVALFVGCLLFSISGRLNGLLTYEQHLLSTVSDHYYLIFLYLPILLLSTFSFLEDDSEQVILRFHSYHAYFHKKWAGAGVIALILISAQTIAILLSGVGLIAGNSWNLSAEAIGETELFPVFQPCFTKPLQAFGVIAAYQMFGSWLVFGLSMWISHFAGKKWTVRILVALYVIAVLWIKIPVLQALPITSLSHLVVLHHNFIGSDRFAITGITALFLVALIAVTVKYAWRGHLPRFVIRRSGIVGYYFRKLMIPQNLIILISVISIVMVYKWIGNGFSESGAEWIFNLFSGHGTGYFQVLSFLEMLISNSAPLYLLAAFVEQTVNGQSMFVSVRAGNRGKLLRAILYVSATFLMVYSFFWLIAGLIGTFFFSLELTAGTIRLLLYAVVLKYLDIFVQYLMMLTVYIMTKQVTIGFLMLVAGNFICIFPGKWTAYSPIGLSSLARIIGVDPGVGISGILALEIEIVILMMLIVVMLLIGRKKLLDYGR